VWPSNLKRSIGGAYRTFKRHKHARRYLAEAAYRFNRCFSPARVRAVTAASHDALLVFP